MLHKVSEVMNKVSAMHQLAVLAHRERYRVAEGEDYDKIYVKDLLDQIQALAGDIYNDRQELK